MKKIQVAKIISSKQIVINAGSNEGIKRGDEFNIIDKVSNTEVKDPATGKSLGKLVSFKGRVIVSEVFEKMSVADAPSETLNAATISVLSYKHQTDLNVDPKEITGGLPPRSDSPIQVGDVLEEVRG